MKLLLQRPSSPNLIQFRLCADASKYQGANSHHKDNQCKIEHRNGSTLGSSATWFIELSSFNVTIAHERCNKAALGSSTNRNATYAVSRTQHAIDTFIAGQFLNKTHHWAKATAIHGVNGLRSPRRTESITRNDEIGIYNIILEPVQDSLACILLSSVGSFDEPVKGFFHGYSVKHKNHFINSRESACLPLMRTLRKRREQKISDVCAHKNNTTDFSHHFRNLAKVHRKKDVFSFNDLWRQEDVVVAYV